MKQRPTSVTVFAIINIVLSGLGVLGIIFWFINKLGLIPQPAQKDFMTQAMQDSTVMVIYQDVATILGIFITILMIAASISMFSLKPWSRLVTIAMGVYGIVQLLLSYGLGYVCVHGPLLQSVTGQDLVIVKVAMIVGGTITLVFIGYYLLMIIMLTRPHVVDAFTPEPDDPTLDGWDTQPSASA